MVERMGKRNIQVKYTWSKFESLLLRLVISIKNKLYVREDNLGRNYEKSLRMKRALLRKPLIPRLYEWFVQVSYCLQILSKITIPLRLGRNLVCDRYIYDTVVDMALDLGYSPKDAIDRINRFLSCLPKPDLVFIIDLPEEVAFSRKDDIPSVEFLKEKRKIYKKASEEYEMVILDGTEPLSLLNNKVEEEALKLINQKEKKGK